jgi:hypothetical protein
VQASHVDFESRVVRGHTVANGNTCRSCKADHGILPSEDDCPSHGTHVASIIGGAKYGVAKDVTIVPVALCFRYQCPSPNNNLFTCSRVQQLIRGLEWARDDCMAHPNARCIVHRSLEHPQMDPNVINDLLDDDNLTLSANVRSMFDNARHHVLGRDLLRAPDESPGSGRLCVYTTPSGASWCEPCAWEAHN